MKKKNFFLAHKQFTFFLILALLIILGAIFAPVVTGGADPLKGSLTEALAHPAGRIFLAPIKWAGIFSPGSFTEQGLLSVRPLVWSL